MLRGEFGNDACPPRFIGSLRFTVGRPTHRLRRVHVCCMARSVSEIRSWTWGNGVSSGVSSERISGNFRNLLCLTFYMYIDSQLLILGGFLKYPRRIPLYLTISPISRHIPPYPAISGHISEIGPARRTHTSVRTRPHDKNARAMPMATWAIGTHVFCEVPAPQLP